MEYRIDVLIAGVRSGGRKRGAIERGRKMDRANIQKTIDTEKEEGDIEGLIFRREGKWTTKLWNPFDGRNIDCQIDYCPWCGVDIQGCETHEH